MPKEIYNMQFACNPANFMCQRYLLLRYVYRYIHYIHYTLYIQQQHSLVKEGYI